MGTVGLLWNQYAADDTGPAAQRSPLGAAWLQAATACRHRRMAEQPPSLGKIMQFVTEKKGHCFIEYCSVSTRALLKDVVFTQKNSLTTKQFFCKA